MAPLKKRQPAWLRVAEIIAGIIVLILAVYVILNPNVAISLLRLILGIGLIILGLSLLVSGAGARTARMGGRVLTVILGIIVIALGVAAIVYTNFGSDLLLIIFAVGLLLNSIGRIAFAGYAAGAGLPSWLRGSSMILGIIALIIAILVIVFPSLGFGLLVLLVALALLLLGIELVVAGAAS